MNYCIIPARGGSKGIPRKNIKLLNGKPLLWYSVEPALTSGKFGYVIVSSEDKEIQDLALSYGALVRDRPEEIAQDQIHSIFVVMDCISHYNMKDDDVVCMLLPTSPLRTKQNIINAIDAFNLQEYDSLISVCKCDKPMSRFRYIDIVEDTLIPTTPVLKFEQQRQDIRKLYEVNGSIYISTAGKLRKHQSFHSVHRVQPFVMNKENSLDINDEYDWNLAEYMLKCI